MADIEQLDRGAKNLCQITRRGRDRAATELLQSKRNAAAIYRERRFAVKLRDLTYENFPGEAGNELRAAHKGFLQWKAETPDWKAQLRAKGSKADPRVKRFFKIKWVINRWYEDMFHRGVKELTPDLFPYRRTDENGDAHRRKRKGYQLTRFTKKG